MSVVNTLYRCVVLYSDRLFFSAHQLGYLDLETKMNMKESLFRLIRDSFIDSSMRLCIIFHLDGLMRSDFPLSCIGCLKVETFK